MSIQQRNGARLFEPGRGGGSAPEVTPNTQFLCHFQPRKPFNITGVNGGFEADESGNVFDLDVVAGTNDQMGMGPVPGTYAAYFDGATGFARSVSDVVLRIAGDVTTEALVKPTVVAGGIVKILVFGEDSELSSDNILFSIDLDSGNAVKYIHEYSGGINQEFVWTDTSIPVNEWTYIAMVRDDTAKTVTLYLNGVAHPTAYTYTNSPDGGAQGKLHVGYGLGGTQFFTGFMAGVRVLDVQRTAAEIAATWKRINPNDPDNIRVPDLLPEISPAQHAAVTLWHEAGQHDTDDGDSVTTPTLLAGANGVTQATVGERPLIVTAGGAPGWKMFDGTATRYFDGAALSNYVGVNGRYHVFVALTLHNADQNSGSLWTNHRIFGDDAGWWGMYARRDGGVNSHFNIYGYHWDGSAKTPDVEPVSRHEIHLIEFWYDTGTLESVFRMDDGAESRVAAGNISTLSGALEIGGNPGDDFQGVIHSIMFANDYDAARAQGIRNYFANKYRVRV